MKFYSYVIVTVALVQAVAFRLRAVRPDVRLFVGIGRNRNEVFLRVAYPEVIGGEKYCRDVEGDAAADLGWADAGETVVSEWIRMAELMEPTDMAGIIVGHPSCEETDPVVRFLFGDNRGGYQPNAMGWAHQVEWRTREWARAIQDGKEEEIKWLDRQAAYELETPAAEPADVALEPGEPVELPAESADLALVPGEPAGAITSVGCDQPVE